MKSVYLKLTWPSLSASSVQNNGNSVDGHSLLSFPGKFASKSLPPSLQKVKRSFFLIVDDYLETINNRDKIEVQTIVNNYVYRIWMQLLNTVLCGKKYGHFSDKCNEIHYLNLYHYWAERGVQQTLSLLAAKVFSNCEVKRGKSKDIF